MGLNGTDLDSTYLRQMPWAEFVAVLGLNNTPPGADYSVRSWYTQGHFSDKSRVLDLACNHGYSSFQLKKLVNAKFTGIDFSEAAINAAMEYARKNKISGTRFYTANAENIPFKESTFTHIIAGCTFGFFEHPDRVRQECMRVLKNGGKLCTANFFYLKKPPSRLVREVNATVATKVHPDQNQRWWLDFFSEGFIQSFYKTEPLPVYSDYELKNRVAKTINESKVLEKAADRVKTEAFQRLFLIRSLLNEHRKYQAYAVAIHTKMV